MPVKIDESTEEAESSNDNLAIRAKSKKKNVANQEEKHRSLGERKKSVDSISFLAKKL